ALRVLCRRSKVDPLTLRLRPSGGTYGRSLTSQSSSHTSQPQPEHTSSASPLRLGVRMRSVSISGVVPRTRVVRLLEGRWTQRSSFALLNLPPLTHCPLHLWPAWSGSAAD